MLMYGTNITEHPILQYERRTDGFYFQTTHQYIEHSKGIPLENIQIGDEATEKDKETIIQLLQVSRCANGKLGKALAAEMKIELLSSTPIFCRPFRMTTQDKEEACKTVAELLEQGVIQESSSPYASPILFVPKKTGERRMCVDYQMLNKVTKCEHYLLPLIEDLLARLIDCCVFSSLDLASGYHQVSKDKEAIPKTAFVTPEGQYEYLRMSFELCNAPSVFHKLMDHVLGPLRFGKVLVYPGDVLIATVEDNLEVLKEVFRRLDQHNLCLKLKKCFFLQSKIDYLGHT